MIFRVLATPESHCTDPRAARQDGLPPSYIGKAWDYATNTITINAKPTAIDSESVLGRQVRRWLIDGDLLPADQETALAVGVRITPIAKDTK